MSSAPRYTLAFLTNEWEWKEGLDAPDFDAAKAATRAALARRVWREVITPCVESALDLDVA